LENTRILSHKFMSMPLWSAAKNLHQVTSFFCTFALLE
jgi:hypothetical protein